MEFPLKQLALAGSVWLVLSASAQAESSLPPLDRTVAVVENQVILQSELDQAVAQARQQLASRQQTPPAADSLRRSVLDQMILQRIQLDIVKRAKGRVDEKAVDEALATFAQQQGAPSVAAFTQAVQARDPGGVERLRQQIRDSMLLSELRQQTLASRIRITDRDLDNFLASPEGQTLQPREYHTLHFLIAPPKGATPQANEQARQVAEALNRGLQQGESASALVARLQTQGVRIGGGDMGWHAARDIDPGLSERLASLQPGQTSGVLDSPQGYQVVQLVESRDQSATLEHQWQVRHILVSPGEGLSSTGAKTRIDQLAQQLQAGKSFADLASTYSSDPGSARAGGELGWVSAGQMVPEFETMMKATPVGQTSAPFQTQFGWHILRVEAERDQDVSQQKLRELARQVLTQRRMEQELDDWLRELRAGAYVDIRDPALKKPDAS